MQLGIQLGGLALAQHALGPEFNPGVPAREGKEGGE